MEEASGGGIMDEEHHGGDIMEEGIKLILRQNKFDIIDTF